MKREDRLKAIRSKAGARWQVPIPDRERHGHVLHVVQIEKGNVPEFFQRLKVELEAGAQRRSIRTSGLNGPLALKFQPDVGSQADVRIDFGKKKSCHGLRSRSRTRQQQEQTRHEPDDLNLFQFKLRRSCS